MGVSYFNTESDMIECNTDVARWCKSVKKCKEGKGRQSIRKKLTEESLPKMRACSMVQKMKNEYSFCKIRRRESYRQVSSKSLQSLSVNNSTYDTISRVP